VDWKHLAKQPVGGREWKESIKRFIGDTVLSARYLPIARVVLGGLVQRMHLGGIESGHRVVILPDLTRIRVISNSGINTIEVATYPAFGEVFKKISRGFIFYPKTDNNLNGIYTPKSPLNTLPLVDNTYYYDPYLPFSTLVVEYNKKEHTFKTTPKAPSRKQSGNQFFVDSSDNLYSWWHSSCGDGPMGSFKNTSILLESRTYFSGYDCYLRLSSKSSPIGVTGLLYKNGEFFSKLIGIGFIAGFWAGNVELKDDEGVTEYRYVAVTVANNNEFSLTSFVAGTGNSLTKVGEVKKFFIGGEYNVRKLLWPVRFSKDGSKFAFLDNNLTSTNIDEIRAIECLVTHNTDSVEITKTEIGYWHNVEVINTISIINNSDKTYHENGQLLSANITYNYTNLTSSATSVEYPIAMTYNDSDVITYMMVEEIYPPYNYKNEIAFTEVNQYNKREDDTYYLASRANTYHKKEVGVQNTLKNVIFKVNNENIFNVSLVNTTSFIADMSLDSVSSYTLDEYTGGVLSNNLSTQDNQTQYKKEQVFFIGFIDVKYKSILSVINTNNSDYITHYNTNATNGTSTVDSHYNYKWYGNTTCLLKIDNIDIVNENNNSQENSRNEDTSATTEGAVDRGITSDRFNQGYYFPVGSDDFELTTNTPVNIRFSAIDAMYSIIVSNPPAAVKDTSKYGFSCVIDPRQYVGYDYAVYSANFNIKSYFPVYNNTTGISDYFSVIINKISCGIRNGPLVYQIDNEGRLTELPVTDPTLTIYPIGLY